MPIKFKLMLAMDAMLLLAVLLFGAIIYTTERAMLSRQFREARERALDSLAHVTEESVLNDDLSLLMNYMTHLRHEGEELELAYVTEGREVLAHTDEKLSPKLLPLSNGGRVRGLSEKLLIKARLDEARARGVTFSSRTLKAGRRSYEAVIGYSDEKVREAIDRTLAASMTRIAKAGGLVILIGTLLAIVLADKLTKPVKFLLGAFSRAGGGDLNFSIEDTARRDEIGTLNREFNAMVARLRELEEMKKDFTSSVTHELKSPLGAIESYLDLMDYEVTRWGADPAAVAARAPKFRENITFIKQNCARLLRFISDLLDASKIEKGRFEITKRQSSIEPLIEGAVQLFSERAKASGVTLQARLPKKLPQAMLDPERISQVLVNLVSNAVKYTPSGGTVTVSASLVRPGSAARPGPGGGAVPDVTGRRALRVEVEDNGIGVPREALARLFDKFYQVPGSRNDVIGPKGTGLGLYIVKNIVEAHDGRAFAESYGRGSRFGFEIPA